MLALLVVDFFVSLVHGSRGVEFRVGEPGFQGRPHLCTQRPRRRRVPAYLRMARMVAMSCDCHRMRTLYGGPKSNPAGMRGNTLRKSIASLIAGDFMHDHEM